MINRYTRSFIFGLTLLGLAGLRAHAQDIHYSQFYASPLTLNPALTGINDCSYRICANYKNQWSSIPAPYSTPSLSFDINSLAPKVIKTGNLSAGALLFNDRSGDGHLNNFTFLLSGGYAIHPDLNKKHTVSVGLQVGYTQKRVDWTKLTFEDELQNGTNVTAELKNGTKNSFGYVNVHAGLLWLFKASEKTKLYLGGAAFNVVQPKEQFLAKSTNKLDMRDVVHAGGEFAIGEKMSLDPSVLYMAQAGSSEINVGTAVGFALKGEMNNKILFGAYYRVGDAVIPTVSINYNNFHAGLSYDVNVSSLKTASNYKGGFEVSLGYTGCISSVVDVEPVQWCPRF